jgi:hypothetical protein
MFQAKTNKDNRSQELLLAVLANRLLYIKNEALIHA